MNRIVLVSFVGFALGCASLGVPHTATPRLSTLTNMGDAQFRASQRLVVEGLDADALGSTARARSRYERALQADSSNPWAYLALARHHVDAREPRPALEHLERAGALLEALELDSPGALTHRLGLRGRALALTGRKVEGRELLEEAARRAPDVWGDGHLSAAELR